LETVNLISAYVLDAAKRQAYFAIIINHGILRCFSQFLENFQIKPPCFYQRQFFFLSIIHYESKYFKKRIKSVNSSLIAYLDLSLMFCLTRPCPRKLKPSPAPASHAPTCVIQPFAIAPKHNAKSANGLKSLRFKHSQGLSSAFQLLWETCPRLPRTHNKAFVLSQTPDSRHFFLRRNPGSPFQIVTTFYCFQQTLHVVY
jgi:hypothetical protein